MGIVAVAKFKPNEHEEMKTTNGSMGTTLKYSGEKPNTPILDTINYPIHMKNLNVEVNS